MNDPLPKYTEGGTEKIRKVCDKFGYGNVMSTASSLWQQKLKNNSGGAYSIGPCIASLVDCGCNDNFKEKCDWCAGTGRVTRRVKEAKNAITKKKPDPPKIEYEIQRSLVVSTGHINKKDRDGIDFYAKSSVGSDEEHPYRIVVYIFEYGWLVWVDPKFTSPDYKGFSPTFKKLIKLAKTHKCQYIRIDRDGPQYDGLEIFTW